MVLTLFDMKKKDSSNFKTDFKSNVFFILFMDLVPRGGKRNDFANVN